MEVDKTSCHWEAFAAAAGGLSVSLCCYSVVTVWTKWVWKECLAVCVMKKTLSITLSKTFWYFTNEVKYPGWNKCFWPCSRYMFGVGKSCLGERRGHQNISNCLEYDFLVITAWQLQRSGYRQFCLMKDAVYNSAVRHLHPSQCGSTKYTIYYRSSRLLWYYLSEFLKVCQVNKQLIKFN